MAEMNGSERECHSPVGIAVSTLEESRYTACTFSEIISNCTLRNILHDSGSMEILSTEPVARGNTCINKYHILREFCRSNGHDCIIIYVISLLITWKRKTFSDGQELIKQQNDPTKPLGQKSQYSILTINCNVSVMTASSAVQFAVELCCVFLNIIILFI
jgi:hypothetical protein